MRKIQSVFAVIMLSVFSLAAVEISAQEIEQYEIKRPVDDITIDGVLDEASWAAASVTRAFVIYYDGSSPVFHTQGQMLWDDEFLYVAMIMHDNDIRATFTEHDSHLWTEEVAEVFIDPDGNGIDYIELEISPLGTLMDLVMSVEYKEGGKADWDWTLDGFTASVTVEGTVNNGDDSDELWIMECAIPFDGLAFSAPDMSFPPEDGDSWRLNLYRYNYDYSETIGNELSAWNQTDKARGFHAPDKFGEVVFSNDPVLTVSVENELQPEPFEISGIFPNPFNPSTTIVYSVSRSMLADIAIYNTTGQKIRSLFSGESSAGCHSLVWNGRDESGGSVSAGVYFVRVAGDTGVKSERMLLLK